MKAKFMVDADHHIFLCMGTYEPWVTFDYSLFPYSWGSASSLLESYFVGNVFFISPFLLLIIPVLGQLLITKTNQYLLLDTTTFKRYWLSKIQLSSPRGVIKMHYNMHEVLALAVRNICICNLVSLCTVRFWVNWLTWLNLRFSTLIK